MSGCDKHTKSIDVKHSKPVDLITYIHKLQYCIYSKICSCHPHFSLTFTLSYIVVTPHRAIQNPETNCLFFPSTTDWSLHLNCNPISCNLVFRGLWKLVSKPLCSGSLWDRTAKARGIDLEDLSSAVCFFFIFSFCFSSSVTFLADKGPRQTNQPHS